MMKFKRLSALVILACVSLGACRFPALGGKGKAPVGQVVATVDSQEITIRELNAELAGRQPADPKQRKAVEQAALQQIIGRKLLAKAAHDQGLDKTPDFALQKLRVDEELLARALQTKIAAAVPSPTKEEAQQFVSDHPDMFANRKIFEIDQIRAVRPQDPTVLKKLEPLNTLPEIEALLTKEHVEFHRGPGELDALQTDPRVTANIVKLPANEIFVFPDGNFILINQISSTKTQPFTGDPAVNFALQMLKQQRTQQAVQKQAQAIIGSSSKLVSYNAAYKPAPGPAAPAAK